MPDLSAVLAAHRGHGYVVAPAGFGKTHLIAAAVANATKRQLVLTHTYAGVNALRQKMRQLGTPNRMVRLDTIASWALRLCLSYPSSSAWETVRPNGSDWLNLYKHCSGLLDATFIRRILRASYDGLYVDEYQDCSTDQHRLILQLARDLPCRVVGDPLQAIFDFGSEETLQWEQEIPKHFECLGELGTPHRWIQAGQERLGDWLLMARTLLSQDQPIELGRLPASIRIVHAHAADDLAILQGNTCRHFRCDQEQSIIAIHRGAPEFKAKCHNLARNIGGRFSSIEEIEGRDFFSRVRRLHHARSGREQLLELLSFAALCMTGVTTAVSASSRRGEHTVLRSSTRNPPLTLAANECLRLPSSASALAFLQSLTAVPNVHVFRADLLGRMLGALRTHVRYPELELIDAADRYQSGFRHKGRLTGRRRLIGTTLLVKGLEFDHAIVLDAASLPRKELYVALTRGARSLTIISTVSRLQPTD